MHGPSANSHREANGFGPAADGGRRSSATKMLDTLDLFSIERPVLSAAEIAARLELTRATAYRYLKTLCDSGLLLRLGHSSFCLGPRVVELDRQIQLSDPLIAAGQPVMAETLSSAGWEALLLCSLARDTVLCIHQERRPGSEIPLKRARGMPFPLFQGPASLAILAHLAAGRIRKLHAGALQRDEAAALTAAEDWNGARARLKAIRKQGYALSVNEFQTGLLGVAAPIRDPERAVIGSVAAVAPQSLLDRVGERELASSVLACAARIEERLVAAASWGESRTARRSTKRSVETGRRDPSAPPPRGASRVGRATS